MVYIEKMVVVVKSGGKILREKDNNEIMLPFGSDYSLYFKNLESRRAVIKVSIDGQDVLDGSSIIIPSNTEFELLGFLKDNKVKNCFKFIQKTESIVKHRGDKIDDGIIRVEYAFEKIIPEVPITWTFHTHYYDNLGCCGYKPYFSRDIYYNTNTVSTPLGNATCSSNSINIGDSIKNCSSNLSENLNNIRNDEGITVKGSETDQRFNVGWIGETEVTKTIIIKLRGTNDNNIQVSKPVTVKTKFKCNTCGRVNKSSSKYCSECGTFLE